MIMKGCGGGLRAASGGDLAPASRGRRTQTTNSGFGACPSHPDARFALDPGARAMAWEAGGLDDSEI